MTYGFNDIRDDALDLMPKEDDFEDCYSEKEIMSDKEYIRNIKIAKKVLSSQDLTFSMAQEYITKEAVSNSDWFGESINENDLFPEGQGHEIETFLTSEYDDYCNHTDIVCIINNSMTDFQPVPFALDLTFNTDDKKLNDKMSKWDRNPMEAPGFATIKYFEDTMSFGEPLLEKGRIPVLPRFVIGYKNNLSNNIAYGYIAPNPTEEAKNAQRVRLEKAKWCVLKELENQVDQLIEYLNSREDKDSGLCKDVLSQVSCLKQYFSRAINIARNNDDFNTEQYVETDEVAQAILSKEIYSEHDKSNF